MDLHEDIESDKKTDNISDSGLPIDNLGISDKEPADPRQGMKKSRRTFLILATILLIGLIAALIVGGIGGGGGKPSCH